MGELLAHVKAVMAKKKFGQNFLIREDILDKIVKAAELSTTTNVLEIGPGPGSLTLWLLKQNIHSLHAIELDKSLQPILESFKDERLHLHFADALKTSFWEICSTPCVLVSNLPYNVASPLFVRMLDHCLHFDRFVLMFQKEVADRLMASPGTKEYGRLSVLTQMLANVEKVCHVPPSAFKPQPKVTSTVVCVTPYAAPRYPVDIEALKKLLFQVFQQRRKMLRASLKGYVNNPEQMLEQCQIDPTRRPETLTLEEFAKLTNVIP